MAMVPRFPPSSSSTQNTANVWSVKGTTEGMLIQEQTAIRTVQTAIQVRSMVVSFRFSVFMVIPPSLH